MARASVLVLDLAKASASCGACADALSEAWGDAKPTAVFRPCMTQFEFEGALPKAKAAVILAGEVTDDTDLSPLLGMIEETGIPIVVLLPPKSLHARRVEFIGGLVATPDTDAPVITGLLRGMLRRQDEIDRLKLDVKVAERFHAGLQTQMAQLHEELQLAAMVQREHLPREIPSVLGVDVGVLYRPANYVSGDIYDIMRLDEDHIGVFLADAVGHGVPAALLTMIIAKSLHTKEIQGNSYSLVDPGEVLRRLNEDMIRRKGDSTRFATAVYALINCRSRQVRIAGAGHPAAFIFSDHGEPRSIASEGGLLGVFPDETYEAVDVELGVNDVMVVYSDGFEQAFPANDEEARGKLPSERYLNVFEQYASGAPHPADMVTAISEQVESMPGSLHQIDDLTLIGVRAGALAQPTVEDEVRLDAEATSRQSTAA